MAEVTIRDLRNHGGEVVDRAAAGERIIVTRSGKPVAELRPIGRRPLNREALLQRWHRLPYVDPVVLRADIDNVTGSEL
ncbi:MAG: type II toxin-antitoxin system Phd/YefM family antitoxin [Acidimicrobiales bacterium]